MSAGPKTLDVLSLGLNATDTLLRLPHFPTLDSKVALLSTHIMPGGQAASAAIACHRWGLRTRYVGKIGDDWAGRLQRAEMVREGVEAIWIEVPGAPSQTAYILIDQPSGERTVLWQHDPRIALTTEDLPRDLIAQTRLLHVDGHPPGPAAVAARWAREAGAIVTADLDNLYPGVEELLASVDYLLASREFPKRVTGIADIPYCPGFVVDTIDTTGAGDIFHAGFAYALLSGQTLDAALEFSCAAAALNCTALGARGGIHPLSEINQLIREGRRSPSCFDGERLHLGASTK